MWPGKQDPMASIAEQSKWISAAIKIGVAATEIRASDVCNGTAF